MKYSESFTIGWQMKKTEIGFSKLYKAICKTISKLIGKLKKSRRYCLEISKGQADIAKFKILKDYQKDSISI